MELGKWWTTDQILDLIAPEPEKVVPVIEWLMNNGVNDIDVSGRDFIKVRVCLFTPKQMHQRNPNVNEELNGVSVRI
jgi:hypothetical protein